MNFSKKLFIALLGLATLSFFGVAQSGWADDPGDVSKLAKENKELREIVEKLSSKVDRLEGRVESLPSGAAVSAAPAVSGQNGDGVMTTQGGGIRMSGFVDTSTNWNLDSPGTRLSTGAAPTGPAPAGSNAFGNTALRVFDRQSDTFELNNVQLNLERPAPASGGVGFNTQFMYGNDAQIADSAGFDQNDEFAIQEAYIEAKVPVGSGITIWAGKFATLMGAEVLENYLNWNSSRSLLFGLAEAFTHTGVRAMYSFMDGKIQTALGLNNGWDQAIDVNEAKDVEASLKWVPNENFYIAENMTVGSQTPDDRDRRRWIFDTVAGWTPLPNELPKLKLMANIDYGFDERGGETSGNGTAIFAPNAEGGPAEWMGYALYARYELTDKLSANVRWEQFWDDQGFRTSGLADQLWEMTYGLDYKVWSNLLTRLEYRHDGANDVSAVNSLRGPFDGNTDKSQDTVGLRGIYTFG